MNNAQCPASPSVCQTNTEKYLSRSATYQIDGKRFVVTPVFRQEGKETLGSVLLKLIQAETA